MLEEPKITELLKDIPERVFPVTSLDKLSSGLLILTNDGRFAYEMTHPKFEKEKEYVVKIREKITPEKLKIMRSSIYIHGKKQIRRKWKYNFPHLLRIILNEGRNRQIRRLCDKAELHIEKLKRIRIGNLLLGNLEPKEYRKLTRDELTIVLD